MLNFFDFEVFKYDWLVVIINPVKRTEVEIVNDVEKLRQYYEQHKDEIWIGYNSRGYDQYVLKAILCGFDPYEMNEHIITRKRKGYEFSSLLNKYPLINYDCEVFNASLKQLEGFQGHNIHESGVDFRIRRKLKPEEIRETLQYCHNDVLEAINVWLAKKGEFDANMELIKEFELPLSCISKTQTQLTAHILGAKRREYNDDFDLNFPEYLNKIKKYQHVVDWFRQFKSDKKFTEEEKEEIYRQKLTVTVAGCPHVFAWGGLHGAKAKYSGEGWYLHIDVNQYYPSLMITHNYFSRSVPEEGKKRYIHMRDESVRLKKFPELKNKRNGYKLINNKTYGGMKDKYNDLYDPLNANNICVTGQLALLLLVEMLEPYIELIQSNTDGLIIKLRDLDDYDIVDDVSYEWEQITGVRLGFDPIITRIYQKDVNNYLFVDELGKVEAKGAYVKELTPLDYDLPIVNKALREYMINRVPVEDTIKYCDSLIEFQKIVKLSNKYEYVSHNGVKYTNKCYRVFASTSRLDGMIYKARKGINPAKFANTPDRAFIENTDITGVKVPRKLDRDWYIELALERLRQFGIE